MFVNAYEEVKNSVNQMFFWVSGSRSLMDADEITPLVGVLANSDQMSIYLIVPVIRFK